jgi:UPF0755 protein
VVEPPVRRPRPSRRQLLLRRGLALAVLVGAFLAVAWLAAAAVRTVADDPPPPPPPTTVAAPPLKILRIVFPEGFTRAEMATRITRVNGLAKRRRKVTPKLSERAYLKLTAKSRLPGQFAGDRKARPLEGFLFPATYEFTKQTTTRQLVDDQVEAFRKAWAKVDLGYARSKNLTAYDVLIIASMIEEEATAPEERPLVAAVIYNRLKIGMPLGIDATIRYGLGVPGTESLRQSHLSSDTPYNTRKFLGLPPTPISNPGLASIQAAAHPARKSYLYYVRRPNSDRHFFTANEAEFYRKLCEYGYGC